MSFSNQSANVQGILLILAGAFLLSCMDGMMKVLLERGYPVLQLLAVRGWMIVPVMTVWVWACMPKGTLTTRRPLMHFVRVVIGLSAPFFFFSALERMPLADATVIFFGTTFIMTALSVPILKERVGPHRWGAVVVGFIGVLIAINPGGDILSGGAVFAFLSSLGYAGMMLFTRWMGPGEGAFKQVYYFHAWAALAGTLAAVFYYGVEPMSAADVGLLAIAGTLAVTGHLCLTRAFSIATVGTVAPFEYTALVWASLVGFVGWGHIPGGATITGAVIIVMSGLYLLHRETRIAKADTVMEGSPPPVAAPVPAVLAAKDGGESLN